MEPKALVSCSSAGGCATSEREEDYTGLHTEARKPSPPPPEGTTWCYSVLHTLLSLLSLCRKITVFNPSQHLLSSAKQHVLLRPTRLWNTTHNSLEAFCRGNKQELIVRNRDQSQKMTQSQDTINLQLGLESSVGSTETQRKHTSSSSTCLGRPIRAVLNAGHICLLFPLPIPFILTIMNCTSSCRYRTALVGSHGHSFMPFCQAPCSHPKGLLFSETLLLLFHGYKMKTCQDQGPRDYFGSQKQNWIFLTSEAVAYNQPLSCQLVCLHSVVIIRGLQCYLGKLIASCCACLVLDTRNNKHRTRRLNGIFQTPIKHLLELRLQLQTYPVLSEVTPRLIPCQHHSLITHSLLF